jgi:peptidoglycan/LPS O-acetylase OafA/YrhL
VRGIAVLLVFGVHFYALFGGVLPPESGSFRAGQLLHDIGYHGVDLFFVLSGYLIYGHYVTGRSRPARFLRRRIERIYPVFLTILAIYLVLSWMMPERSKLPDEGRLAYVVANVALLPGVFSIRPIITVAWSLSYEMFFYLLIPVLVGLAQLRRWAPATRVRLWMAAGLGGVVLIWFQMLPRPEMLMFLPGMILFDLERGLCAAPGRRRVGEALALLLCAILFPLAAMIDAPTTWADLGAQAAFGRTMAHLGLVGLACFLLIGMALLQDGWTRRALEWSPIRWLGNISYTYYLLHGLVVNACALVLLRWIAPRTAGAPLYWGVMVLVLGASIVVSAVFYLLVERRAQLALLRRPPAIPPPAPALGEFSVP